MHWSEARDTLRKWRENNVRNSLQVVKLWDNELESRSNKLGDEYYLVLEQVFIAALDCNRPDVATACLKILSNEFPGSMRINLLKVQKLEAAGRLDEALEKLDNMIKMDETNAAPRKRRVAILKAKGKIPEAIKELTEYLKKFMIDQEAWQELCDLYLSEQEYNKAAFCMEELILHNPHNHLFHQRYAEIKYTQGGYDNLELAKAYYCQALKLNPNNMRSLYGLFLTSSSLANFQKSVSSKKKEALNSSSWAFKQITNRYQENEAFYEGFGLEKVMSTLQISSPSPGTS